MVWEKGRQLKSFGSNVYTYNAAGIRTSKTVGGIKHTYTLDGAKILREQWVEGENIKQEITPLYDNEDNVCGILYGDIPYYFLKNLQGDVIAITNQRGETVARYTYDAWGACTVSYDATATPADEDAVAINIATVNPFRYRSYYFDTETGLYYLQSRYYDPALGRFVNADLVEASTDQTILGCHLFSYCENDPINDGDESGSLSFKKILNFLDKLLQSVKKVWDLLKGFVDDCLTVVTGISPKTISAIAKEIKRSPHRVRQSLQKLTAMLTKAKGKIARIAGAITVIALVCTVANKLAHGIKILDLIAGSIVEGLSEALKWLISKGVEKLISLIPSIGAFLGFCLGKLIEIALDVFLSSKFIKSLTAKFQQVVNVGTYKTWNYIAAYFKCWA